MIFEIKSIWVGTHINTDVNMRRAQKTIMIYDCWWRGGSLRMNRTLSYIKGITFAFQKPSTKRSEYLLLCTLKFMKKCINCSTISEWFMKLWNWKSTARTELYKLLEMDEKLKLRLLSKQSNIGAAYWKMLTSCLITVSE